MEKGTYSDWTADFYCFFYVRDWAYHIWCIMAMLYGKRYYDILLSFFAGKGY